MQNKSYLYVNANRDSTQKFVNIELKAHDSVELFHTINRMLSLLDTLAPHPSGAGANLDAGDQKAYEFLDELNAALQLQLDIK